MSNSSRVARGVAFLDATVPDWHWRINVGTLDVAHGCRCVLGQLFETFGEGCRQLQNAGVKPIEFGFGCAAHGGFWENIFITYPRLTKAWKKAILAKRAQDERDCHVVADSAEPWGISSATPDMAPLAEDADA